MTHRRFQLNRIEDITGISGSGIIAEGILYSSGKVTLNWSDTATLSKVPSISVFDNLEQVERVHGHSGSTRIEWLD